MKKMTLISSSLSLGLLLALSGCNSTQADAQTVTVSGKAIDPYLKDATVYMDTNANGKYDQGEPNATTNAQGDYDLNVSQEYANKDYTVYATGGTDVGTGKDFNGTLTAVQENNVTNITPLTTLVQARYEADKNATLAEIQAKTAKYLDLNVSDIDADIVKLADDLNKTQPLKTALALEKIAEAHANDYNGSAYGMYADLGKTYAEGNATTSWKDDANLTDSEKEYVDTWMKINVGDLNGTGTDANSTASGFAEYANSLAGSFGVDSNASSDENTTNQGADAGSGSANAGAEAGSDNANQGATDGNATAHQGVRTGL